MGLNSLHMTWEEAKQFCFGINMTLIAPEYEYWTSSLWQTVNQWPPIGSTSSADSFQRFWTGFQEIGGEWVKNTYLEKNFVPYF